LEKVKLDWKGVKKGRIKVEASDGTLTKNVTLDPDSPRSMTLVERQLEKTFHLGVGAISKQLNMMVERARREDEKLQERLKDAKTVEVILGEWLDECFVPTWRRGRKSIYFEYTTQGGPEGLELLLKDVHWHVPTSVRVDIIENSLEGLKGRMKDSPWAAMWCKNIMKNELTYLLTEMMPCLPEHDSERNGDPSVEKERLLAELARHLHKMRRVTGAYGRPVDESVLQWVGKVEATSSPRNVGSWMKFPGGPGVFVRVVTNEERAPGEDPKKGLEVGATALWLSEVWDKKGDVTWVTGLLRRWRWARARYQVKVGGVNYRVWVLEDDVVRRMMSGEQE